MQQDQEKTSRKVKITYEEYSKIATEIIDFIRKYEEQTGIDTVQQADIVNKLVELLEVDEGANGTSLERAEQTSRKVQQVVQHLITKENVLIITQDSKTNKNERLLCLNINAEMAQKK